MNFDSIKEVKKRELEGIGIIGMDNEGNFEFSDSILDDDMEDIEKEGKKILKSIKPAAPKKKAQKEKKQVKISEPVIKEAPRRYSIQFNKNEVEEAELAFATLSSLGPEVEIKDIFNYVMTKGFSADEKFEIQKIASSRLLEEKLNKYLKENKLKMDKEELLLHLLNEKLQ
ncbi:hypothetical protein [Halobacteriovorax sp.]|uniref:hypothetical protein n=1 Tax=Halobacteriovorax sp. TaxID=2020862 RepID=UPI003562631E